MILTIIVSVLGLMMFAAAILALHVKSIVAAVVSSGVISLFASIIFLIVAAPDVAMTEAAIGSGLTTMVFLYSIYKFRQSKEEQND